MPEDALDLGVLGPGCSRATLGPSSTRVPTCTRKGHYL